MKIIRVIINYVTWFNEKLKGQKSEYFKDNIKENKKNSKKL